MEDKLIFDRESLLRRLSDDEELMQELLTGFLKDIPRQIVELREALGKDDRELAMRISHTIKGSALNYSAPALGQAAAVVYSLLSNEDMEQARSRAVDIGIEFDRVHKLAKQEWHSDGAAQ